MLVYQAPLGTCTLTCAPLNPLQKLHIQTVPLEEQPRRIAHQPATRTYGVITTQATMGMGEWGGFLESSPPVLSSKFLWGRIP